MDLFIPTLVCLFAAAGSVTFYAKSHVSEFLGFTVFFSGLGLVAISLDIIRAIEAMPK